VNQLKAFTRQAACASTPLGVLAFWSGLWMAGHRYPVGFDWRYMTLSSLVYPDRNPHGYQWAWGGLTVCALGGLYWAALLTRDWPCEVHGRRPAGIWALAFGYLCMACCALLAGPLLPIPKLHQMLAISSFVGLCIGVVQLTLQIAERGIRLRPHRFPGSPRIYAFLLAALALSPVVLAGVTPVYVSQVLPELPWVGLEWRVRGVPLYLSFALWEWIACAVFSAYTIGLCLATMWKPDVRRADPAWLLP
jgi:hypothetical protein